MSYPIPPDVLAQIDLQLQSGEYATPEDVLRDAMQALKESQEDWLAIKEALDAVDAGEEGIPLDEAVRRIRERNT